MDLARIFVLVWGALAISWGLFLIIRRNWMSELARALKQQSGMRLAFGSQSPRWMLVGGIGFLTAGAAILIVLALGVVK